MISMGSTDHHENVTNGHVDTDKDPESLSVIILEEFHKLGAISEADNIKLKLLEYEQANVRKFEEKEQIINQLKQSLVDLTEKRFRALNNNNPLDKNVNNKDPTLNNNLQFVLGEKDIKINKLVADIDEFHKEINNLKSVIKDQDNVILSHNNNIYEVKCNNETVMRAKQESFRMMNEDLKQRQQLIDDQELVIKNLKDKVESLEEKYSESQSELEVRLNQKDLDLQTKIAVFEANLYEGRQYFEEILNEKDSLIKEKNTELIRLKKKLGSSADYDVNDDENELNSSSSNPETFSKYDNINMENMKLLYEKQIEILKDKNDMLEKTCRNYRQGIKEMNKSIGYQQQADEMSSMHIFKELMQELQRTNAQLETEKIDLKVRSTRLAEDLENTRVEKENLNKKLLTVDQLNHRLTSERGDLEQSYQSQLNYKQNEILELTNGHMLLRNDYERIYAENEKFMIMRVEYEELQQKHSDLTQHYEQLYTNASDIVTGNNMLNEQVTANASQIEQLEEIVEDYRLKVDHLGHCNSELNTQKINLDMKLAEVEAKMEKYEFDLKDLDSLKSSKVEMEKLMKQFKELESELIEKNELIEQLNQAKEYLVENNSRLLTNNIKIQLFVESMGLDLENMEQNSSVKEYEFLRNQFKEAQAEIAELNKKNKEIELNSHYLNEQISRKEKDLIDLQSKFNEIEAELTEFKDSYINKVDASTQSDDCEETQAAPVNSSKNDDYTATIQYNFNELQDENEALFAQIEQLKEANKQTRSIEGQFNELKANYDAKVETLTNLEQTNAKLKAKLKQYIKQKKQTESEPQTSADALKETTEKEATEPPANYSQPPQIVNEELTCLKSELAASNLKISSLLEKIKHLEEELVTLPTKPTASNINSGPTSSINNSLISQLEAINDHNYFYAFDQQLKISDLTKRYKDLAESHTATIQTIESTNTELTKTKKNLRTLQNKYDQQLNLAKIQSDLIVNSELNELKKALANTTQNPTENPDVKAAEVISLNEKIYHLEENATGYVEQLNNFKEDINQAELRENNFLLEIERLNKDLADCKLDLGDTKAELNTTAFELNNKIADIVQLNKENANLNESSSQLAETIKTLTAAESALKLDLESLQKKYDNLLAKAKALKGKKAKKNAAEKDEDADSKGQEEETLKTEIDRLKAELKESEMTHEVKLQALEATQQGNLLNALNDANTKSQNEIKDLNQMLSSQIEQCESNFTKLQKENDSLSTELSELKPKLAELLNIESTYMELLKTSNESATRITTLENQNLKYKTKLKQLLAKQKQQQLQVDNVSRCSTPCSIIIPDDHQASLTPTTLSPNAQHSSILTSESQTELTTAQINLLNETVTTLETDLESSRVEVSKLKERIAENIDEHQQRVDNLTELNKKIMVELAAAKKEASEAMKSITNEESEEIASIKAKLDTVQAQNIKLKTKLKQLIEKNKKSQETTDTTATKCPEPVAEVKHVTEALVSTSPEETELSNDLKQSYEVNLNEKSYQIQKLTQELNELKERPSREDNKLQDIQNELQNTIKDFDFKSSETEQTIQLLNSEITVKNLKFSELTETLQEERTKRLKSDETYTENFNKMVDSYEEQLAEKTLELETMSTLQQNLEDTIQNREAEIQRLTTELTDLNQKLTTEVAKLSTNEIEFKNSIELKQAELDELSQDLTKKSSQLDQLNENLRIISTSQQESDQNGNNQLEILHREIANLTEKHRAETENLQSKIFELTTAEAKLKSLLDEKQLEVDSLKLDSQLTNEQIESNFTSIEKRFTEEMLLKEEQITQLNEDLSSMTLKINELKLEHEASLSNQEKKYVEQLAKVNELNEQSSRNSDLEFSAKQNEIERLQQELAQVMEKISTLETNTEAQVEELSKELNAKNTQVAELHESLKSIAEKHTLDLQSKENATILASAQTAELQNLINHKQKMTEDLTGQISDLKQFIESQRNQYETQLNNIIVNIKEKDMKLNDLSEELNSLKSRQFNNSMDRLRSTVSPSRSENGHRDAKSSKGQGLQEQLKHCNEKCEMVADTLNQLKQHNENLNNKIKSYRGKVTII